MVNVSIDKIFNIVVKYWVVIKMSGTKNFLIFCYDNTSRIKTG